MESLDQRIATMFPEPRSGDIAGLLAYVVTAELHGRTVFERLAVAAGDDSERRDFWSLLAAVEARTLAHADAIAARHRVIIADRPAFIALGHMTAAHFAGGAPDAYFAWVGPSIASYTERLRDLLACFTSAEDRVAGSAIVAHERAIEQSSALLDHGLAAAAAPLAAFLEREPFPRS